MEKKITISAVTQEGNYSWEASGQESYYAFLSAQVVLQDTLRTIINSLRKVFQKSFNRQTPVSQHFQKRHSNGSKSGESYTSLSGSSVWLKQATWHTSRFRQSPSVVSWGVKPVACAGLLLSLWNTLISSADWQFQTPSASCYLFSCGQLQTRRILHSSCQSTFQIGDDSAGERRGEYESPVHSE